jgi:1-acyl-sn-glycerol-3-phosphate acyltransferase
MRRFPPRPGVLESLLRWAAALALSLPLLTAICLLAPWPARSYRLYRTWARAVCRVFGVRVTVEDLNTARVGEPLLVVVLNQTSLIEALVYPQIADRPFRIIMNIEFALIPFLGWAAVASGGIVIFRGWASQARRGLERAGAALRNGATLAMSIEGYRSRTGELSPYKKGAVVLGIGAAANLLPVSLHGARERLPYGAWRVSPGEIRVVLHPVVSLRDKRYEDRHEVLAQLRATAEAALA